MSYSESDTRAKYIDPSLKNSSWEEISIIREYYFTDGRKALGGKRGKRKYADYILTFKGVKLAIIEAKKEDCEPTEGLEQVKEYCKILNLRFVYSTNGKKIYEFDLESGKGDFIDKYPTPEELYNKVYSERNLAKETLLSEPFLLSDKKPRYYQEIAINKTMEAIGTGKNRILLTLATGTGKTVIAFQTVYKLFNARWSKDGIGVRRPRILFLADRNILVDQAMNTFNPLEKDILKINGVEIKKRGGKVPTNSNIFFSIYQALVGGSLEDDENRHPEQQNHHPEQQNRHPEQQNRHPELVSGSLKGQNNSNDSESSPEGLTFIEEAYYNRYPKDFFDMIIIDECHRGGAREDGNWSEILKYFDSAVHLGLTATPKRDDNVDTYRYFGKPVYEYSLKAGIDDGFLTPFKIKRIKLNIDELVLNTGDQIIEGIAKKDVYYTKDMEREIVIDERSDLIAQTILQQINKMDKTIVFCVDQSHALRIRDSINKYKTVKDSDYCVRVTSNEGEIGRTYLERFQDNDKDIPVILTSSQMLTTGVDALNVRNIVLVRNIGSIVEYKQIIGRGTRIFEGKDYFTILDFVGATNDFKDEVWDGGPEDDILDHVEPKTKKIKEIGETGTGETGGEKEKRLYVRLGSSREVKVIDIETRYLDPITGKHLSSEDFLKKIIGDLPTFYKDEHQLRELWSNPETRDELLHNLANIGLDTEQLEDLKRIFEAQDSDIFDVLAHLSYGSDIKYRSERSIYGEEIVDNY
ncbi:MAG: DEAD/DEAH box helicase family protein, partial [Candidatus Gracilibacteria bacterium]|nr:DEAD/DEAH box helicase family protein [Candidatus Gracilibacteria bacterium]